MSQRKDEKLFQIMNKNCQMNKSLEESMLDAVRFMIYIKTKN